MIRARMKALLAAHHIDDRDLVVGRRGGRGGVRQCIGGGMRCGSGLTVSDGGERCGGAKQFENDGVGVGPRAMRTRNGRGAGGEAAPAGFEVVRGYVRRCVPGPTVCAKSIGHRRCA
jgi:hypothetical protein